MLVEGQLVGDRVRRSYSGEDKCWGCVRLEGMVGELRGEILVEEEKRMSFF